MNPIPLLPEDDDVLVGQVATRTAVPSTLVSFAMLSVILVAAFVLG